MANSKGPSSVRAMMYTGKNSLLPPKIPFPSISPSYAEYIPTSAIAPKSLPKPREGNSHHQRTSSESVLIEEQPSWLDDLLNEPETPLRRGHRRSSSDSFAYVDLANGGSMMAQDDNKYKNVAPLCSWGSQDLDIYRQDAFCADLYPSGKSKNSPWGSRASVIAAPRGLPSPRGNTIAPNAGSSILQDADSNPAFSTKRDLVGSGPQDTKGCIEKKDSSHAKSSSEIDAKRSKQQFAQRSRVRKLQYIAELERDVQALQAEGSEVSAEFEFLNQQNLILSLENKALKQRLESLAQEQLIKHLEHEVLEREVGRLRALYQQQQQQMQHPQQQQKSSSHRRANSKDLDHQFASLSLKHNEASIGRDSFSGQLHM